MKFENTEVFNIKGALRGMRNPLQSHHKSDSKWDSVEHMEWDKLFFFVGENDMALAQKLIRGGAEHRKFLRQIEVCVDITAPLYWWKEFDTYKVGTVANSTSTMHKIASTPITKECFEMDAVCDISGEYPDQTIADSIVNLCENYRKEYLRTKDKRIWRALIQILPESWLQTRTITMSYENVFSMIHHRKNHKLTEWRDKFINWARTLPYAKEWLFLDLDIENHGKM